MIKNLMAAAAITLAASGAQAQSVAIDDTFLVGGGKWDGLGSIYMRFRPVVANGEILICGAYSSTGGSKYTRLNRQVVRGGKAVVGNRVLSNSLSFFNQVSNSHNAVELVGQTASCMNTGVAADGIDLNAIEFNFRSGRYRRR